MRWEVLTDGTRRGLRLHFIDEGPGIPDLKLAMTDGWTSGTGLGLGLSGAKRLVNEFDIETAGPGHPRHHHALEVTPRRRSGSRSRRPARSARCGARHADGEGRADEHARGEVAIVATELATNLARHARDGRLLIQALDCPEAHDGDPLDRRGPGHGRHAAVPAGRILDGGHAGQRPGRRAAAVERVRRPLAAGEGTVVLSRLRRPGPGRFQDRGAAAFRWAAICMPAPHEKSAATPGRSPSGWGCAVLVADGLGHGPLAAEAATGRRLFEEEWFETGGPVERAHRALTGTRGAAMAVARIGAGVRYAGVGNISGVLGGGEPSRGMISQNGTVGLEMRKVWSSTIRGPRASCW